MPIFAPRAAIPPARRKSHHLSLMRYPQAYAIENITHAPSPVTALAIFAMDDRAEVRTIVTRMNRRRREKRQEICRAMR